MNILLQLQKIYFGQQDVLTRNVNCGISLTVTCLDTMCDDQKVCDFVLQPLLALKDVANLQQAQNKLSFGANVTDVVNLFSAVELFTNGYTLVFDQDGNGFAVDTRTKLGRAIVEPPTSMVMRGPREGFVEDAKVNVTLLRKRLKTPNFKIVNVTVGKYTNTAVSVCYLDGIASQKVVNDVTQRLQRITVDGVLDSSYLANYLDENKTWLFRRVGLTEKPDVAVGKMLEGRVAIVVDGSPMVLTLPYLFIEDVQSPADYYENHAMTTVSRCLRFASILLSVLLPSLYVCLQAFNYQIIPLKFLITILNASQAIPFSPLAEMMAVLIIFDILREANLRMPSAVGISLSLVGAIVLGDAAVKAGLLGAPSVMIGALSGIGLFAMPDNTLAMSGLRLAFTFVGGTMGLLGVIVCTLAVILYLCSLQNYDTPFLSPYAPNVPEDKQDAVFQSALPSQKRRPSSIRTDNKTRKK